MMSPGDFNMVPASFPFICRYWNTHVWLEKERSSPSPTKNEFTRPATCFPDTPPPRYVRKKDSWSEERSFAPPPTDPSFFLYVEVKVVSGRHEEPVEITNVMSGKNLRS